MRGPALLAVARLGDHPAVGTKLLILAFSVMACGCAADNSTQLETPRPGYACGTGGVVCVDASNRPTGECCWEGSACLPQGGCEQIEGRRRVR